MSSNLISPVAQPIAQQVVPMSMGACTPVKGMPSTSKAVATWNLYRDLSSNSAAIYVNLVGQGGPYSGLDAIRSVYIDNTFSSVAAYIQFPDTLFTVVCPPYSVCCSPVYTSVQEFYLYAEGFSGGAGDVTTFFLSNIDRQGFVSSAVTMVDAAAADRIDITLTDLRNITAFSGVQQDFASVNFGFDDPARYIIIVAFYQGAFNANAAVPIINGIGINGAFFGTTVQSANLINGLGSFSPCSVAIAGTSSFVGTTGTVNVSFNSTTATHPANIQIGVISAIGAAALTQYGTSYTNTAGANINPSVTPNSSFVNSVPSTADGYIIDATMGFEFTSGSNPATHSFATNTFTEATGSIMLNTPVLGNNLGTYFNLGSRLTGVTTNYDINSNGFIKVGAAFN